jgi:pseudolysin
MRFRFSVLMAGLMLANAASAATPVYLRHQSTAYMQNQLAGFAANKVQIKQIRTDIDFNHTAHTRIQQTYAGIPVWDATGVVHTPHATPSKNILRSMNDNTSMNGVIYEGLEKDLANAPGLALTAAGKNTALQIAKDAHAKLGKVAPQYQHENSQAIIFIDDNKQAHYAYLVTLGYENATTGAHKPAYIIDAVTKHIYRSWDQILTAGTAETKALNDARVKFKAMKNGDEPTPPEIYALNAGGIGGNPNLGELVYDGAEGNKPALNMRAIDMQFEILPGQSITATFCALMSDDIVVLDTSMGSDLVISLCTKNDKNHNGTAWLSLDKGMTRWSSDEMNQGHSPSLDAFYAATVVKNLYHDWYDLLALVQEDGTTPMPFVLRVHFGRSFDNAFWDGQQMTFGDGGRMFYPLTSVGVTAHEISHGFTSQRSQIDYSLPQMGALHESFSDMAAVAAEYFTTGSNHWEIGREIMKGEGALRYLDNPGKDGHSIDNMKDFDDTEAHSGAGITNKAFYLLATTKGWNTRKAFDVMVKANMHYWTSSMTTLTDAACGVVAATKDYGYDVADVRIAFAKVGIDTDNCNA